MWKVIRCSSFCVIGKALQGQAREIVRNVYNHIKEQNNYLKFTFAEATSDATGVSTS